VSLRSFWHAIQWGVRTRPAEPPTAEQRLREQLQAAVDNVARDLKTLDLNSPREIDAIQEQFELLAASCGQLKEAAIAAETEEAFGG